MMRASGQRALRVPRRGGEAAEDLKRSSEQMKELQDRYSREISFLKRQSGKPNSRRGEDAENLDSAAEGPRAGLMNRNSATSRFDRAAVPAGHRKEREIESLQRRRSASLRERVSRSRTRGSTGTLAGGGTNSAFDRCATRRAIWRADLARPAGQRPFADDR